MDTDTGGVRMSRLIVMLLALACTDSAPKGEKLGDSQPVEGEVKATGQLGATGERTPALLRAAPLPRADTTRWQDTSQQHDTLFFSKGRAITSTRVITDSTWYVVIGVPFGPFDAFDGTRLRPHLESFTLNLNGIAPYQVVPRLELAREKGVKLVTNMTGGAHRNYMSLLPNRFTADTTDSVMQFDMVKWKARMDLFNTPEIQRAIAQAVTAGTLWGNIVMDEPANISPDNSWGPKGTMNKARVDSMCAYGKSIFPTLHMGVTLDWAIWNDQSHKVCDFQLSQYRQSKGDVRAYRKGALDLGRRDKHAILFSMNILDGGTYKPGCPIPETGGMGTYGKNCRMTPRQIEDYGTVLGEAGCGLLMWAYREDYFANPAIRDAFNAVGFRLSTVPRKSCTRR